MSTPVFFGYGSLVNRATHAHQEAAPATAIGWHRAWRRTPLRRRAILTAVPRRGARIEGLVATVADEGGWAALDHRERAYNRVALTALEPAPLGEAVVYAIPTRRSTPADAGAPILLSYLDVVMQGYLHEFGEDGLARFVETTEGWDTAHLLDDRAAPRYPRAQTLTADETALVDAWLARLALPRI